MALVLVAAGIAGVGAAGPALASSAGLPGAPQQVTAVAADSGAVVSWQPPASDGGAPVTGYVITSSPGKLDADVSAVTSFQVGGLVNGRAYTFTVAAVSSAGTGPASKPSAPVTPRPPAVPGAPRSVRAVAGFEEAVVSWSAPAAGGAPISGYLVRAAPGGKSVTVAGDALSAVLPGLRNGTRYVISVTAASSAGAGKAAKAKVTPAVTAPGAPVAVTAAPVSTGVSVAWQPPAADGGSPVTGYVVAVAGSAKKVSAAASARSVTISGLTQGHTYEFTVAARNAKGTGQAASSAPAAAGGTVASAAVVLSAASLSALTQVGTDGSLTFASPTAQVTSLTAGDILVAGVSGATPNGLLAEVTSVSSTSAGTVVATEPASLNQALQAAGFGMTSALSSAQVASFVPARAGVRLLPAARMPASAPLGSIGFSLSATLYQSSNGATVTASGSITLTPKVSFSASITSSGITSSFTGTVTAAASVKLSAAISHDISGGYPLGTVSFNPIYFSVLGVPIVITPALALNLTSKGTVTAGLTTSASDSYTVGVQVTTKNTSVSANPVNSHSTTWTPPAVSASMSASAGVEGALTATVDGVAGVSLTDNLWLAQLTVSTASNPWWTLSAQNIIALKFNLTLLGSTFTLYSATLADTTIPLAKASGPFPGITIGPSPAMTAAGGTLQLSASSAAQSASAVTWAAQAGGGSVSPSGLYTAPDEPGVYQVTAALPADGLQPAASGTTSVQVGSQPPDPPTDLTAESTSDGDATLSWTPPADDGGSPVTSYTITSQPDDSTYPVDATATSADLSDLTPGQTYTFTITATSAGGTSVPSAPTDPLQIDDAVSSGQWTAAEAPLPDGGSDASINDVTCSSALTCIAVGSYTDTNGTEGLLLTEAAGTWSAQQAPLPSGGVPGESQGLSAVTCPDVGTCVAVGMYYDSSGDNQGEILTDSAGTWSAAQAPLPGGATTGLVAMTAVACGSDSSCVVTGSYDTSDGSSENGLLLTGFGSAWTATQAPVPDTSASDQNTQFASVACPAAGTCFAVGDYYDADADGGEGLLDSWDGSSWSNTPEPLPADASYGDTIISIACGSTSSCVAVGTYWYINEQEDAQLTQGLLLSWSTGTGWTADSASFPGDGSLSAVACPSADSCTAVGYSGDEAAIVTGAAGDWSVTLAPLPDDADSDPGASLSAVACGDDTDCVAAGTYLTTSSTQSQGMVLGETGGTWSALQPPEPADADTEFPVQLTAAACTSATSCLIVGAYNNEDYISSAGLLLSWSG